MILYHTKAKPTFQKTIQNLFALSLWLNFQTVVKATSNCKPTIETIYETKRVGRTVHDVAYVAVGNNRWNCG